MKKILFILLSLLIVSSLSFSCVFATDVTKNFQNQADDNNVYLTITSENGENKVVSIQPEETIEVDIYLNSIENRNLRFDKKVATLVIARSGISVYFKFTPVIEYAANTLGFTGSFSITNFSGLSLGTYWYTNELSGYVPAPSGGGHAILSGSYTVIGVGTQRIGDAILL